MTGVFEDHLGLDAIVAYVDGELSLTAYQRAASHLGRCEQCAAEVAEQTMAQQYLRSAGLPRMPGSLFDALKSIPVGLPQPGPVPGLTLDAVSGQASHATVLPRADQSRGRRFKFGAGALVAGIAMGAVIGAAAGEHPGRTQVLRPDVAKVSGAGSRSPLPVVQVRMPGR